MSNLQKDARGFVDGIVDYLKTDGKRTNALPKVQNLLMKVSDRAAKEKTATVKSVVMLSGEEKNKLEKILGKFMHHPITVTNEIDTSLIGGMRIEIADFIIDTSYKGKLEGMTKVLMKGSLV